VDGDSRPGRHERTSLTNEVVHRFAACPYGSVKALHWRSPLDGAARGQRAGERFRTRIPRRGRIGASWRLLFWQRTGWRVYWARWAHLRAKGYILAFDFTYFDVAGDATGDSDRVESRLGRALWSLLPKPDLVFVQTRRLFRSGTGRWMVQRRSARRPAPCARSYRDTSYQPYMCSMGVRRSATWRMTSSALFGRGC
jgi:hypothetical protein